MHIGIQVTPHHFILAQASAPDKLQILAKLPYPADNPEQAAALAAAALPPSATSVMMSIPASWTLSWRYSIYLHLYQIVPEIVFVPTPIATLHLLSDWNQQDIFWWEPWGEGFAFGFISILAKGEITLEGYQTGSKADCIQTAQACGYYKADLWSPTVGLRPAAEVNLTNLLPVKLSTCPYSEEAVLLGLTVHAFKIKAWLESLKIAGALNLRLLVPGSAASVYPLPPFDNHIEYPYQQYSRQMDFTHLRINLPPDTLVHIIDQNETIPLWSGTLSMLHGAALWVHPASGQVQVIADTRFFLPYQPHPQSILENRLNVPLPSTVQDVTASLQLMLHHLKTETFN